MLLLIERNPLRISQIRSYGCQFAHNGGGLFLWIKRVLFAWLANIWYLCQPHACKHIICLQPCNPCQSACKYIIVCKPGAHKHIICLQARLGTHLVAHAKVRLGKHPICNFLCRCIGISEWLNATFVLLQCWLKKGDTYHSSLHLFLVWGSAIFFGECVSLISAKNHLFIFSSTLTLMLADCCRHP